MITRDSLKNIIAGFVQGLVDNAKEDTDMAMTVARVLCLDDAKFTIVGGWNYGIHFDCYGDLLCVNTSNPNYAMCVRIVENTGVEASDFASLQRPIAPDGTVEDTTIALEWNDDVDSAAAWLLSEWERIMKEHGEEVCYIEG